MRFQSLWEFVLWSQLSASFSCQILDLWSAISLEISLLSVASCGSSGFCLWILSRRWSLSRIAFGSGRFLTGALPFGMFALSARSIVFVNIVFAVWTLFGGSASASVLSICWVKSVQLALL